MPRRFKSKMHGAMKIKVLCGIPEHILQPYRKLLTCDQSYNPFVKFLSCMFFDLYLETSAFTLKIDLAFK